MNPSPQGGVLWISSGGDDRRIFWGLKFSIPGFFWVGKFGKYFFGWLDLSMDFWGIQNDLKIRGSACAPGRVVLRVKYNQTCSCPGGLVESCRS